ncbi:MAG: dTMP kinase [Candidatus Dormibacteraeota bacterium]|nr:dTMP kinase [Candidatus Dormibacteraeota bacterium]
MSGRGLFITFEGTEGSGKTTQVELLGEWLSSHDPVVVREPGGTELGERIREVVLYAGLDVDAEAEMYLFMAARRQLISEVIAPALAAGQIVIADRYHDSTLAYQGGARGVPATWPPTFPRPDITFLLEGPVETGLERQATAGKAPDRMEQESIEFHRKVAAAYGQLAAAEPARFVRIDAGESREKVHLTVKERLTPLVSTLGGKG